MEKLKSKIFGTIFGLLSMFLLIIILFYNAQNYRKEYLNLNENLIRIDNFLFTQDKHNDFPNKNLNNKIIMDYDVYTVLLNDNNSITEIISHGETESDFDVEKIANKILLKEQNSNLKINNLYFSKYSYNLKYNDFLIIISTINIRERLISLLITSLILSIILELVIFYTSKKITAWLIKPALDSFKKQKEFVADASHELKTPLAIIMASAESLENDPTEKKWLNNIKSESDKMSKLITSLLDLSKLESGINKTNYKKENISKIIEKSALTFESLAYENNLSIELNITKDVMYNCSAIEINELVSILLDNALKHSFKNSKIRVNLYKEKNNLILDVVNKGDKIPKEDEEKIFERFYRLDKSRNRNSSRYGLGLAIAKNIVENHNGMIKGFSNGEYTTFRVILKNKEH